MDINALSFNLSSLNEVRTTQDIEEKLNQSVGLHKDGYQCFILQLKFSQQGGGTTQDIEA